MNLMGILRFSRDVVICSFYNKPPVLMGKEGNRKRVERIEDVRLGVDNLVCGHLSDQVGEKDYFTEGVSLTKTLPLKVYEDGQIRDTDYGVTENNALVRL